MHKCLSVSRANTFSIHAVTAFLFFMAVHWYPLTHKDRSSFFSSLYSPKIRLITSSLVPQCVTLHFTISYYCAKHWQQCRGRNNKCSLYCLLSKFCYESLEHHSLLSLKKKILLKTKALPEVLLSHSSQTRVSCLLKNFSHYENQIQRLEQHLHGNCCYSSHYLGKQTPTNTHASISLDSRWGKLPCRTQAEIA